MEHNAYTVMLAKIRAFRATRDVIAQSLRPFSITVTEWLYLGALDKQTQAVGPKQLAEELNVSMPLITRYTKQLQAKGYITMITNESDRRERTITLSHDGERLLNTSEPVVRDALKLWLEAIPQNEIRTYITVLLQVAYKI